MVYPVTVSTVVFAMGSSKQRDFLSKGKKNVLFQFEQKQ